MSRCDLRKVNVNDEITTDVITHLCYTLRITSCVTERDSRRDTKVTARILNSSDLYELLHDTLLITEEVKETLRTDCDEATYVLRPWRVETTVENRADGICTCKKIARENKAEEIAAEIGRAISLAQELREKLKLNVTSRRTISERKGTLESIYSPSSAIVSNRKRSDVATRRVNTAKSPARDSKESTASRSDKATSVATKQSSKFIGKKRSTATDKARSKTLSTKVVQSRGEKNFILENKLKVKKISLANKLQADSGNSGGDTTLQNSRKSVSPKASAAALSDLIHDITRRSTENALTSPLDGNTSACSLHGENAPVQEQITPIDVVEALRYFDVPNEIVRVLRAYHAFLKIETHSSKSSKDSKAARSLDGFLSEFEAMSVAARDISQDRGRALEATADSISAFSATFSDDLDSMRVCDMKNTVVKLTSALKRRNKEGFAESIVKESSLRFFSDFSLTRGWMSNGIWNTSCMEHFESFSKSYNITYRNKEQLLSLYEAVQKLQLTEYQNKLIRIVLRDVIPAVESTVEPSSAEYARVYKTLFVLCQGLNPKVPVLVSADS